MRKKSDAHKIQDELSILSHSDLLNELEKLLDKYAGDDEHILIDRLELDLGTFSKDHFQSEFLQAFAAGIDEQIEHQLQNDGVQENISKTGMLLSSLKESSDQRHRSVKNFSELTVANDLMMELLESFLLSGTLPWWYREEESSLNINEVMESFITNQPVVALNWIKSFLVTEQRINRLQNQFLASTIEKIEDLLGGESGSLKVFIQKFSETLEAFHIQFNYVFLSQKSPWRIFYLHTKLIPEKQFITTVKFLEQQIVSHSISFQNVKTMDVEQWLKQVESTLFPALEKKGVLRALEDDIPRKAASKAKEFFLLLGQSIAGSKNVSAERKKPNPQSSQEQNFSTTERADLPQEIKNSVSNRKETIAALKGDSKGPEQARDEIKSRKKEEQEILTNAKDMETPAHSKTHSEVSHKKESVNRISDHTSHDTSFENKHSDEESLADRFQEFRNKIDQIRSEKGREDIDVSSHVNKTSTEQKVSSLEEFIEKEFPEEERESIPKERYLCSNGGIVILWPYLARFFNSLDLQESKNFKSDEAKERAIHLLHYLVWKEEEASEHHMMLNKLLCDWPLEEPINRFITLKEEEKEECENLLQAVLDNWGKLGSTSTDNFREAFLQRNSILYPESTGWLLKVEKGSFDMLLDSLPWGKSMVKLSWMKKLLRVEW